MVGHTAGEANHAFVCAIVGAGRGLHRQRRHRDDLWSLARLESRAPGSDRITAIRIAKGEGQRAKRKEQSAKSKGRSVRVPALVGFVRLETAQLKLVL